MADDFRIAVEFQDEGSILHFGRLLREREFEKELRDQLGDGVIVTRDGNEVFLYASTPEQARAADRAVRDVLEHQEVEAAVSPVERWHPVAEVWEDASVPLPQTDDEVAAEHARQEADEAHDSRDQGYAEWEVRVDLPTHRDAVELAERLEAEGISPLVRRWKYLLIGTATGRPHSCRGAAGRRRKGRAERGDRLGADRPEPIRHVRRLRAGLPLALPDGSI
jgi:hypothetical protein